MLDSQHSEAEATEATSAAAVDHSWPQFTTGKTAARKFCTLSRGPDGWACCYYECTPLLMKYSLVMQGLRHLKIQFTHLDENKRYENTQRI